MEISVAVFKNGKEMNHYRLFNSDSFTENFKNYFDAHVAVYEKDIILHEVIDVVEFYMKEKILEKSSFVNGEAYSEVTDFSGMFLEEKNSDIAVKVHKPLYRNALSIRKNSYVFMSYNLVHWLKDTGAIKNINATGLAYNYSLKLKIVD